MLTVVGSVASVVNGLARGIIATLTDKFGFKRIYIIL